MILLFLGCLLTSFGPMASLLYFYISKESIRVILSIMSAFYWTIVLLIISIIQLYAKASPIPLSIYVSIYQEICRVGLYYGILKLKPTLISISNQSTIKEIHHHVGIGYGIGLMSGLIQYTGPLFQSLGYPLNTYSRPGMLMCTSCPRQDVYFIGRHYGI